MKQSLSASSPDTNQPILDPISLPNGLVEQCLIDLADRDLYGTEPLPNSLLRSSEKRQREFQAGRHCARRALSQMGIPSTRLIDRSEDGSPVWPVGIVGSISHAGSYAWAMVGVETEIRSIGIDTEVIMPDTDAGLVAKQICNPRELKLAASFDSTSFAADVTLLFSAKEAAHKCWAEMTRVGFDPLDYEIIRIAPNVVTVKSLRSVTRLDRLAKDATVHYRTIGTQIFAACLLIA